MPTLYLASRNAHKIEEIQSILGTKWHILPAQELDPQLNWEETGTSFRANALIKAQALRKLTKFAVLADDSGLEVDALGGKPGVYSSRYAGEDASDSENLQKLIGEMRGIPAAQRQARFVCVLCYLDEHGEAHYFEGRCEGRLSEQPKGTQGFGYDPIFVPQNLQKSFAELNAAEKNQISHRQEALKALQIFLNKSKV
ncbi:MAG: RdgB/HAM1 family non-canonical purine NTP pyrophosphatase [Proteobacteria bacterium]|nr:RdgB/HAM1 family non-canonical purine NTP pyrophosphatase [Pseudomonadota bacterium]